VCVHVQSLAEDFADRAGALVDLNERALTLRTGGLRGDEDDAGPRGGYQDGQYSGQSRWDLPLADSLVLQMVFGNAEQPCHCCQAEPES
jgi:hypothetical protein